MTGKKKKKKLNKHTLCMYSGEVKESGAELQWNLKHNFEKNTNRSEIKFHTFQTN